MGLSEWTLVYARGHKKILLIHQFMMDHPFYAIILQIHTFNT